jgi:hypothetical protein
MPASRTNYIVTYEGESQIYASAKKEIALETPPPPGHTIEDKHIFFITHRPDDGQVVLHEVPRDEVLNAELKIKEPKKTDE